MKNSTATTSAERMVGIHVFLQTVGSFIFFVSIISFGRVQKISWVKLDTLVKLFNFLKTLNDQLSLQLGIWISIQMAKHDLTQFDNCTVGVAVKVSS